MSLVGPVCTALLILTEIRKIQEARRSAINSTAVAIVAAEAAEKEDEDKREKDWRRKRRWEEGGRRMRKSRNLVFFGEPKTNFVRHRH